MIKFRMYGLLKRKEINFLRFSEHTKDLLVKSFYGKVPKVRVINYSNFNGILRKHLATP